jgi:hypothetical protein
MEEEKTAMSQAKKKSIRDCREKTPMSSKKIRKTPKAHPWSFLFPSHTIIDIRLFLLQKASSKPKTDPGRKRKKNTHTLHGSRKLTKRLKRREENHQQIRRSKTQRGKPLATEEEEDQNTDRDGS